MRIKSDFVSYTIMFCLIFTLLLLGCSENVVVRKPVNVARAQNSVAQTPSTVAGAETKKQTIKNEDPPVKEVYSIKEEADPDDQKEESNFFNFNSDSIPERKKLTSEDKQEMMEKALDLLEVADKLWEKGDIENTLNTLDEAYALLLNANGDAAIAQEKDDLRLLISRRILAVYSAKEDGS